MRAIKASLVAIVLLQMSPNNISGARAAENEARLAAKMWAAFTCSTYAELSNQKAEQGRLFELGYETGKQFLDALQAGTISKKDFRSEIPVVVTRLLAGPSDEFILGRIFEHAAGVTFDAVVDADGMIPSDIVFVARTEFDQANCRFIASAPYRAWVMMNETFRDAGGGKLMDWRLFQIAFIL